MEGAREVVATNEVLVVAIEEEEGKGENSLRYGIVYVAVILELNPEIEL